MKKLILKVIKNIFGKMYLIVLMVLLISFGIRGIYWVYKDTNLAVKSNYWQKTNGIVLNKDIEISYGPKGNELFTPKITYSYFVNDTKFINNTISFPTYRDTKLVAQKKLSEYPLNHKIIVYYDQKNPKLSCLEPGRHDYFFIIMISAISLLLLFIASFILYKIFVFNRFQISTSHNKA